MKRLFTPVRIEGTFGACPNLPPYHVEALERLGIPPDALAGPTPMRTTRVHLEGRYFEFEHHHRRDGAEPAHVFLILDGEGEALDIVAWLPSPDKVATWLGRAWALGEERIHAPRLAEHGGLLVHRSPVEWLRARQDGIVILRPEVAADRLACASPLLAGDSAHGDELDRLLTRPKPRILIPSSQFKKAS